MGPPIYGLQNGTPNFEKSHMLEAGGFFHPALPPTPPSQSGFFKDALEKGQQLAEAPVCCLVSFLKLPGWFLSESKESVKLRARVAESAVEAGDGLELRPPRPVQHSRLQVSEAQPGSTCMGRGVTKGLAK